MCKCPSFQKEVKCYVLREHDSVSPMLVYPLKPLVVHYRDLGGRHTQVHVPNDTD